MADNTWLNDEAINMYMVLLQVNIDPHCYALMASPLNIDPDLDTSPTQERNTTLHAAPQGTTAPRTHIFHSFFYEKLARGNR
jgi:hypothetical protein